MPTDDASLLLKAKKLIESKINWGDSNDWTNQDFIALSEKIQEHLKISISYVTLKRIWGKVKYNSLPTIHTLNTLVQFVGYENWREFKLKNSSDTFTDGERSPEPKEITKPNNLPKYIFKFMGLLATIVVLMGCILTLIPEEKSKLNPEDFAFSSKKVVSIGVPNSVVFDFEASKAPTDTVIIQQSWDSRRRTKVPKEQHQHTSIYYYPEFYRAKLVVGNEIVREHHLLIKSDGWLTAVNTEPVPVYFEKKDVFVDGKMALPIEKIRSQNIKLQPETPWVVYANVQDLGEIYTDNFVFETSVKNNFREGSSLCQQTNIYLVADLSPFVIPLCFKGCISNTDLFFAGTQISGKKKDLSAFGTTFDDFVKVRIESENGRGKVFLNDSLVYEAAIEKRSKIYGVHFGFAGTGAVDYVKLTNGKVLFEDQF